MMRTVPLVLVVAATVGACASGDRMYMAAPTPNPYDYRAGPSMMTTSYVGRSADPKVYTGPRSNMMDCSRLTLAQRQFFPLYRYGCADLPTPGDAE
jgi:hypothetical protein